MNLCNTWWNISARIFDIALCGYKIYLLLLWFCSVEQNDLYNFGRGYVLRSTFLWDYFDFDQWFKEKFRYGICQTKTDHKSSSWNTSYSEEV